MTKDGATDSFGVGRVALQGDVSNVERAFGPGTAALREWATLAMD